MNDEPHKHYSELMQHSIDKQLSLGRTVLIICNKQGHSSGMLCTKCGHIPRCHQCDIAIAYHQTAHGELIGLCHICKTQYAMPEHCSQCRSDQVKLYGVGIQQLAKRCQTQYQINPLIIDSTKTNSLKKMEKLKPILQSSQLIIATSLLRTPPSDKQIDLIVLLHADQ
jgi:primosomal protein N' (replication factor Y)